MDTVSLRTVRRWLRWLAASVVALWVLSLLWWALLEPAQARAGDAELIIPKGTAAAVQAGADPPFVPNSIELARSGDLIVINRDTVAHQVGSWSIPAGGLATISASEDDGQFTCTIHPTGILGFSVDQRPSILSTFYAAFALGLPLGIVFALATTVTGRLRAAASAPDVQSD